MEKIAIKKERMANRCEICHKADKFYPKKNYCKRCYKFIPNQPNINIQRKALNKSKEILFLCLRIFLFTTIPPVCSIIMAVCGAILFIILANILDAIGVLTHESIAFIGMLLIALGFISGFIFGIHSTVKIVNKNLNTSNNTAFTISDSENQPYWADSKNLSA